ncbi:MAG: hypothetical protein IIB61_06460, partial [Planctomycetes bacterium]|nr:hypothetical protein [Planctomycetota bacterium]
SPDDPKWMKYYVEFCVGTHLKKTAEASQFVLVSEEAVAKGVRRVVGVSGDAARQAEETGRALLTEADHLAQSGEAPSRGLQPARSSRTNETCDQPASLENTPNSHPGFTKTRDASFDERSRGLKPAAQKTETGNALAAALSAFQQKVSETVIPIRVRAQLRGKIADLQKVAKAQAKQDAAEAGGAVLGVIVQLYESAGEIGGVKVVVGEVPPAGADALRGAIDWVRNKTAASAVLLVTVRDNRVTLVAGMSKAVVKKGLKAGDLIREIAPMVGGKGGGRPDMAQGGGSDATGVSRAIAHAGEWISQKLTAG